MWRSPDKILVRIAKTLFLARQPHLMSEGGCPFIGILSFLSGVSGIEFSLLLPSLSNESSGRKEKGSFPDSIIGFKAPTTVLVCQGRPRVAISSSQEKLAIPMLYREEPSTFPTSGQLGNVFGSSLVYQFH